MVRTVLDSISRMLNRVAEEFGKYFVPSLYVMAAVLVAFGTWFQDVGPSMPEQASYYDGLDLTTTLLCSVIVECFGYLDVTIGIVLASMATWYILDGTLRRWHEIEV